MANPKMNDPAYVAELTRKSVEARAKKREKSLEKAASEQVDPWKILSEIAGNRRSGDNARTAAAKALMAQPAPDTEQEWRSSVQVRSDYEPPSWPEVFAVAKAAGAL